MEPQCTGLQVYQSRRSHNQTYGLIIQARQLEIGANLQPIEYLAIDESEMCTLDLVTLLSQFTGKVHVNNGAADSTVPFGGLNILLMGDFYQFPPVANVNAALYCMPRNRNMAIIRKVIFMQFKTVVNLMQQWRINDVVWTVLLEQLHNGECSQEDLNEMHKLVLTNPVLYAGISY